jgi:hypothetical protein
MAVFSELMLRGVTINSKATLTGGKGCHDFMGGEKILLTSAPSRNMRKNGASGNMRTTAVACPATEYRFMVLINIPSLTSQSRFQSQRWSLELKSSR